MIPIGFKPMLAVNINKVKTQPISRVVSEKLDGVRCLFFGGVAYSRSLKPLPNKLIQSIARDNARVLEGCDGEVLAGDIHAVDVLQRSTSFSMKEDKIDDFCIYLFDRYHPAMPWIERYESLYGIKIQNVKVLEHFVVREKTNSNNLVALSWVNLELFEQYILQKGGEGVMLRDAFGKYKCNRSGTKTPELQKVKRFEQDEFKVVGYTQFETNENTLERDERGYAKRSTSKEGKRLIEALGSLVLALPDGRTFNAGSGFTEEQRLQLWEERSTLQGRLASIQYFGYSYDGIPLLPVFKAFRSELDIS